MKWKFIFTLQYLFIESTLARILVFLGENYEDCSTGGKPKYIDYSGLEYEYFNDTEYFLNGNVTQNGILYYSSKQISGELRFLKEMRSPLKYSLVLEKFDRGQWHVSILNRKGNDLCPTVQSPSEPWYDFFSKFEKKECPWPAGHVEKFNMLKVANAPDLIPFTFIGKYRATMIFEFQENDGVHLDCAMLPLEIMNV